MPQDRIIRRVGSVSKSVIQCSSTEGAFRAPCRRIWELEDPLKTSQDIHHHVADHQEILARKAVCTTSIYTIIQSRLHLLGKQNKIKMPKRKANDLGDGVSVDEPRRSSRRISTPKETPEVKPATAAKKAKKSKKVEKEGEAETNGDIKEKESEETVSSTCLFCTSFRYPKCCLPAKTTQRRQTQLHHAFNKYSFRLP